MLKQIIYFFLSIILYVPFELLGDDALYILKNRIQQMDNFYACFVQRINNIDGTVIESGQGELWIKRPNFFHYHILNPEEIFLISDGKTLWFYVPVIKQVTAYCLKNRIIDNIFLKLLFNYDISELQAYNIIQKKNWFYLEPIVNNDINFKKCKIKITEQGIIDRFLLVESNGQYVDYTLFNQHTKSVDANKFSFTISEGIQLDDQR